jgi:hypothetical protein
MNPPFLLQIVLWIWLVLALFGLGFSLFLISKLFEDDDALTHTYFLIAFHAVIAFSFGSLMLVGHALTALWLWRVAGSAAFVLALVLVFRDTVRNRAVAISPEQSSRPPINPWPATALIATTLFTAALATASFLVKPAQTLASPSVPLAAVPLAAPPRNIDSLVAVALLALITVVFAGLFIRETRQSGPPSFETFATGLGGDATGWQVSPSLTYLLVTVLFASFFITLATRSSAPAKTDDKAATDVPTTSATKPAETPTTKPAP